MSAYYNEFDPFAAAWLRELIKEGLIADGEVDERSIVDVRPGELRGFTQCHFFAGIGGWSYALRLAGWDDDRPVWTGSCPCQPFSAAGARRGTADERHLWPEFYRLIFACRPPVVFGEQVASRDGLGWLLDHTATLQRVRDRETVIGVLREQERAEAFSVSRMRDGGRTRQKATHNGRAASVFQRVAGEEQGEGARHGGSVESEAEGASLHGGCEGHSGSDRRRPLRVDGHSVQLVGWQDLGQPIPRQDRLDLGLYADEHAGGALLRERDGEYLGAESDSPYSVGDFCSSEECQRQIDECLDGEVEAAVAEGQSSVRADLETAGYAVGATDLGAASVGAFHIRQRLWFVADAGSGTGERDAGAVSGAQAGVGGAHGPEHGDRAVGHSDGRATGLVAESEGAERHRAGGSRAGWAGFTDSGDAGELADTESSDGRVLLQQREPRETSAESRGRGEVGELGHTPSGGQRVDRGTPRHPGHADEPNADDELGHAPGVGWARKWAAPEHTLARQASPWASAIWHPCRDGRARPIEPGIFPLAARIPNRVGQLRGAGNAIVPQVAAEVIRAYMETCE